jgi:hypothetical protein
LQISIFFSETISQLWLFSSEILTKKREKVTEIFQRFSILSFNKDENQSSNLLPSSWKFYKKNGWNFGEKNAVVEENNIINYNFFLLFTLYPFYLFLSKLVFKKTTFFILFSSLNFISSKIFSSFHEKKKWLILKLENFHRIYYYYFFYQLGILNRENKDEKKWIDKFLFILLRFEFFWDARKNISQSS